MQGFSLTLRAELPVSSQACSVRTSVAPDLTTEAGQSAASWIFCSLRPEVPRQWTSPHSEDTVTSQGVQDLSTYLSRADAHLGQMQQDTRRKHSAGTAPEWRMLREHRAFRATDTRQYMHICRLFLYEWHLVKIMTWAWDWGNSSPWRMDITYQQECWHK